MGAADLPSDSELLQQVHWIRGLAYAILRDHELSQDVSQEVLLMAISGEPRHGRILRAWLAAVTRNLALSQLRERSRRTAREARSARSVEALPARDPLEVLEAHEAVTQAMHALPADAREVILLRFFEDFSFHEISRRLGIREEAARMRLHRGLEQLREALGRQRVGWKAWCAMALPSAALASRTSVLASILTMKATKAIGVLLLALLLVFAFLEFQRADGVGRAEEAGIAATKNDSSSATEQSPPEVPEEQAVTRSDPPGDASASTWTIRGVASYANSGPAGGVRVRAILHDGYDEECPVLTETVLVTAPNGAIVWELQSPERATYARFDPEQSGVGYGDARLILSGQAPPQDLAVILFHWTTPIRGVVRNEAGEPIPEAKVRGGFEPVFTDTDGKYSLVGRAGNGEQYLYAEAEGYAQERVITKISAGEEGQADFVLRKEFVIRGRVLDEAGAPVEGATVNSFGPYGNSVLSALDGSFELHHLERRTARHQLFANKKGYAEAVAEVETKNRLQAIQDLVLVVGVRVEGTVLDPNGEPIEGASLYLGFSPSAYNRVDAVTHRSGNFVFANVAPGKRTLVTRYPGFAPDRRELSVPEKQKQLSGLIIRMSPGIGVKGQVFDESGTPLPDAWVSPREGWDSLEVNVQTDVDGCFEIDGLPESRVILDLYKAGFSRLEVPLKDADRENMKLTMRRSGGLRGRVINESTGEPITDFRIRLFPPQLLPGDKLKVSTIPGDWGDGINLHDVDGVWATDVEMDAGRMIGVEASAAGFCAGRMERVLISAPSEQSLLEFRLLPGAGLRGKLLPRDGGAPVANAHIAVLNRAQLEPGAVPGQWIPWTSSDEEGFFEFQDLMPGQIFLRVSHAEWMPQVDGPFELLAGSENAERILLLDAGTTMRGRVLTPGGLPMPDLSVEAYGHQIPNLPNLHATGATDSEGKFAIPHLPLGRYRVLVVAGSAPQRTVQFSKSIVLSDENATELILQLVGSSSIRGTVTSDQALPEKLRVALDLYPHHDGGKSPLPSGLLSVGTFVVNGQYEFPAVEAGEYAIRIWSYAAPDGRQYSTHQRVTVPEGSKMVVNLRTEASPR